MRAARRVLLSLTLVLVPAVLTETLYWSGDSQWVQRPASPRQQQGPKHSDRVDPGFGLLFRSNEEELRDVPVTFTSPLPPWMNGTLVRNGMGKFENGPRTFVHAFDGFAKLVSWRFQGNSTALFSTRFLRSHFYSKSMSEGTIAAFLCFMAVKPPFSFIEEMTALHRGLDNMNVNIYKFPSSESRTEDFAALSDYWKVYTVDIADLSTRGSVTPQMDGTPGLGFMNLLSTSHPLPEPGTSNILSFLSSVSVLPWRKSKLTLTRATSLDRRDVIAQWSVDRVPYMHSFSVTATKAILLASPFYQNFQCMVSKFQAFLCMDWEPHENATFYVVDLQSGDVLPITSECVFTMHHANAYDESATSLIMDISTYPSPDFVKELTLDNLRNYTKRNSITARPKLKRFRLDLKKKTVTELPVDIDPSSPNVETFLDFPVINENYRSRRYCWLYGLVPRADNQTFSAAAIVKKDLCGQGKGDKSWRLRQHYPGEAWFVARPGATAEDDGLLLVPVLDGPRGVSYLAVLDAMNLTLVTQADTPTYIPYTLHGRYFD